MPSAKKRTGRPSKKPKPGSRVSLGLKVTAEIKQLLDAQAKVSGRTQSQEAELRLEQSFWQEDLLPRALRLAYGKTLAGVLLTLGETIKLVGLLSQYSQTDPNYPINNPLEKFKFSSWEKHPLVVSTAFSAARKILELMADPTLASKYTMPEAHESGDADKIAAQMGRIGYGAVVMILKDLRGESASEEDDTFDEIRALLGPFVDRLNLSANQQNPQASRDRDIVEKS